jgi:hypothetical protein
MLLSNLPRLSFLDSYAQSIKFRLILATFQAKPISQKSLDFKLQQMATHYILQFPINNS